MKTLSAVVIFIFLLPYSASVYMGLGYLFNAIFPGIDYFYCMLFIAVLTSIYLVLGGYVATAISDFVQGILMIAGVLVMAIFIAQNPIVGGISEGLSKLRAIDPDLTNLFGGKNGLNLLWLILLTSFGTWGLPQMVHKFYAIKDNRSIKRATVISTLFAAIIGGGAYFVGSFGRLYLGNTVPAEGYDKIVPEMLLKVFTGSPFSGVILSVILLCVLSASMSTLAAVVMTSGSAVSIDLIAAKKPSLGKKKQLLILRIVCLLFVALSFLFATMRISFIIALMSFSWGAVSGCFIGPYVWGLYWKRTTRAGAWAGMVGGLAVMVALVAGTTLLSPGGFADATANSPAFGVAAMAVSMAIVPLVSLATGRREPDATVCELFDAMKREGQDG